ncbi:choline/ethanolamine transporter flvcr2a-like [Styela clava]
MDQITPNENLAFDDENNEERQRLLSNRSGRLHSVVSSQRWIALILGSAVALINGFQNLQFAGFEPQIVKYYKILPILGDLLTQTYYISFVILGFPVIWLIMKKGLRFTVISAAALSAIGAVLTVVSTTNNQLYSVALISEFFAGVAQVFVLCLPSLLAGSWFPSNEVSTASGTIVFFYELGNGIALLIPPFLKKTEEFHGTLGKNAVTTFAAVALCGIIVYVFVQIAFKEPAVEVQLDDDSGSQPIPSYLQSLKDLMTNKNFVLLFFSYGIDFGIFSALHSLFKIIVYHNFLEEGINHFTTGQIVAFMILVGTPAPIIFGLLLDYTKKFIWILGLIHFISILSSMMLIFAMETKIMWLTWVSVGLLGFGLTGKMSVGLETAAEMTYPIPEGTSSGLLVWSMSLFTTIFIQVFRFLLTFSNLYLNVFVSSCLIIAFIFTCFMKEDLRRSKAQFEAMIDIDDDEIER